MNKLITPLHAAHLCRASYHNFDTLDGPVEALEDLGYRLLFSLQSDLGLKTEGWALVNQKKPYVVLVFPGSKSLRDWILNFKAKLKRWYASKTSGDWKRGNIAEGAWIEWDEVWYPAWKALRGEMRRLVNYSKPMTHPTKIYSQRAPLSLIITGHSRGAQLAKTVGLSLRLHQGNYYDVCLAPCFAPPRTGDLVWCQYYNPLMGDITWDYVNGADIVPHLPPSKWSFCHATLVGERIEQFQPLNKEGRWVSSDETQQWPRTWEEIDKLSIRDHSIDAYIKALEKLGDQ